MARLKVYVDTSVVGSVCDAGPQDRLEATRRLLDALARGRFDGYISTLVLEEVQRAPESVRDRIAAELKASALSVLDESTESLSLARLYIAADAIPASYEDDARHVAVASVHGIGVLVSWNFRHMVNVERKRKINSVNLREGLSLLDLVSPWELRDDEH